MSVLRFVDTEAMELSIRTPPVITGPIQALCRELDPNQEPRLIPVRPDPGSRARECFFNVRDKVENGGGQIQFGWGIWEWPRVLIEAEFHAIWISPEGEQIDITPRPNDAREILFLPDSTRTYDYSRDYYRIDHVRRPLTGHPLVAKYIELSAQVFECEEKYFPGRLIGDDNPAFPEWDALRKQLAKIGHQIEAQFPSRPNCSEVGRNDPCPCGSGKKYKKCHGRECD